MQSNSNSYGFASFSLNFLQVGLNNFDYFWKPNSPFSKFVLTFFWWSKSHTLNVMFWVILKEPNKTPARWWPWKCLKCVSGLRRIKKSRTFFWVAFMSLTWWPGAQFLLRYKRRKVDTLLFYFTVLANKVASLFGMIFLFVGLVFNWSFLVLQCHGNVGNWIQELIWSRKADFEVFLMANGLFRGLHTCMDWNLLEFLKLVSLLTTSKLFDLFRLFSALFSKYACTF